MLRIADLRKSVNHGALPVRLECNVDVDSGASGWVTQILPVGWNGWPGVLDPHIVPRNDWRREGGEGHWS